MIGNWCLNPKVDDSIALTETVEFQQQFMTSILLVLDSHSCPYLMKQVTAAPALL